MATTRGKLLSDPRSGARPLGGSPGADETDAPARPLPKAEGSQGRTEARKPAPGKKRTSAPAASRKRGEREPAPRYRDYQTVVLAEFVAAEVLVALTPIATRRNMPGLSPYVPRDMTKLLAIGVVYFVLELVAASGGKTGRVTAWFGALVLLAVGLNEAANVAKVLDLFGGGTTKTKTTAKGGKSG